MSVNAAKQMTPGRRRFERYVLTAWAVTMLAFVVWLLIYTVLEFRPSV